MPLSNPVREKKQGAGSCSAPWKADGTSTTSPPGCAGSPCRDYPPARRAELSKLRQDKGPAITLPAIVSAARSPGNQCPAAPGYPSGRAQVPVTVPELWPMPGGSWPNLTGDRGRRHTPLHASTTSQPNPSPYLSEYLSVSPSSRPGLPAVWWRTCTGPPCLLAPGVVAAIEFSH